jgi:hypothetical protein
VGVRQTSGSVLTDDPTQNPKPRHFCRGFSVLPTNMNNADIFGGLAFVAFCLTSFILFAWEDIVIFISMIISG